MNDHPPAPPNSKFFKEIDGKLYFLTLTDDDEEEWIEVAVQAYWYWRTIIGAVATEGWYSDGERITKAMGITNINQTLLVAAQESPLRDAIMTGESWRTWARGGGDERTRQGVDHAAED